jgi:putative mRNA 3-end processing factor
MHVAERADVRHVGDVRDGGMLGVGVAEGNLVVRGLGLALDPSRPAGAAFVSHAHAAGAPCSGPVLASRETAALAHASGWRTLAWDEAIELPVDADHGGGTARLSLARAGHVLGAAQLVVDHARGRLVYAGDWCGDADPTLAAGAVVPCDELIVGAAFGLPIFRFDPRGEALAALVEWCAGRIEAGRTPAVIASTPGNAQAVVHALSTRGLSVVANERVRADSEAYEALGVAVGRPGALDGVVQEGATAVVSPEARATSLRGRKGIDVAYASAWALLDAAVEQRRADAAFVLADRADHDALVAMVRASGARHVFATRGEAAAFAHLLRREGMEAEAIPLPAIDDRGAS